MIISRFKYDDSLILILVGPGFRPRDDYTECRVKKELIMEKSEYFREIFVSNPHMTDINIFYDDPKSFSIAIEVIKGKHLASSVQDLDNLFSLVATAEEFKMNDLKEACLQVMSGAVNFQTVWKIYDTNHAPSVIENCEWLLKTRAKDLLAHPHFLDIKPETLSKFLKLQEMDVDSETVLFEESKRFLQTGKHGRIRIAFRKYALPYLRVLNLTRADFRSLHYYITSEENSFLKFVKGFSKKPAEEILGMCLSRCPRRSENSRVLVIEPDKDVYDSADLIWDGPYVHVPAPVNKYVLSFVTKRRLQIHRVVFFCPVMPEDILPERFRSQFELFKEPGGLPIKRGLMSCTLEIVPNSGAESMFEFESSDTFWNKTAFFKLNVEVPESAQVSIAIEVAGEYKHHKFAKSEATIFECSDPCIQDVLGNVTLSHLSQYRYQWTEQEEESSTTIFKSVHMNIV